MPRVMPSQVVKAIDSLFEHAKQGVTNPLMSGHSNKLRGVIDLVESIPPELIELTGEDYSDFVLATGAIKQQLETWAARGSTGNMPFVKDQDAITLLRRALAKCPDEHSAKASVELAFISDATLQTNIGRDVEAAHRALTNSEWKAATVLAGATIEALLHWKLSTEDPSKVSAAATAVVTKHELDKRPPGDLDRWVLNQYIVVAKEMNCITETTAKAALLAKDFRNLIHPGAATRLNQECNQGTSHTAIGALRHVIEDLRP